MLFVAYIISGAQVFLEHNWFGFVMVWARGRGGFVNPWNVIGQALLGFALGQILTTKLVGLVLLRFGRGGLVNP